MRHLIHRVPWLVPLVLASSLLLVSKANAEVMVSTNPMFTCRTADGIRAIFMVGNSDPTIQPRQAIQIVNEKLGRPECGMNMIHFEVTEKMEQIKYFALTFQLEHVDVMASGDELHKIGETYTAELVKEQVLGDTL
jgi:hypothetical protein